MKDRSAVAPTGLNERIAQRVASLRAAQGLSLDALAHVSSVSRSMISLIERGESSATAVVLEKLAAGLGVPLASLFDAPQPMADPVARAASQPWWRDPHSGYERRNVSAAGTGSPIQIVEIRFPPRAQVSYESGERLLPLYQQVWVLEGRIEVTVERTVHTLDEGDCLAMRLNGPTSFRNPTRRGARYAVVLAAAPSAWPSTT